MEKICLNGYEIHDPIDISVRRVFTLVVERNPYFAYTIHHELVHILLLK